MMVLPQFLAVLILFGLAFGVAALPCFRSPRHDRRELFRLLVPHPAQPSSMLSFVALSCFLNLVALTRFGGVFLSPLEPVNSPDSSARFSQAPRHVDIDIADGRPGAHRFRYPRKTADLTLDAARRVESAAVEDRLQAVRDLAWWTAVCPNYGPFTLRRLVRGLRDPDPRIKGAAAIGLGSTGGHGAAAVPDLLAARGTTVAYFDHLVAEAVFLIEHSPRWAAAAECEDVPADELERRMARKGEP